MGPFADFLHNCGIMPIVRYAWYSGVKRMNRTLIDMIRSIMSSCNLPDFFLGEALKTTTYIRNRVPRIFISKMSLNCGLTKR